MEEHILTHVKFKTFGCGSGIATSSVVIEIVQEMRVDKDMKTVHKDVACELDGLPPRNMHCSNLAAQALHEAIGD